MSCRLPSTFRSLYRIFLRTRSASVLHHRAAKRNLRELWRPVFDDAVVVIRKLQHGLTDSADRERFEKWLEIWEFRMDNTVSLLYNSARSRGLSHELTKNLAWLFMGHRSWAMEHYYNVAMHWKPNLPPNAPQYRVSGLDERGKKRLAKGQLHRTVPEAAWGALGEVVRMAEGRHGLSLGKMTFRERKA